MADSWSQYLAANNERFLQEYLDLLRIPSISTMPSHKEDVQRCAAWVASRLQQGGIEGVQILPTAGHPVVYGEWLQAPGKPTVLFYGHFDVQPADPLELWQTPPFEPTVREGRIYARGASDMKGNLLMPIIACESLLRTTGALPINVKFLFEGEEESGSPSLSPFIAAHQELLGCDFVVSADGGQHSETQPALAVGLRGMCAMQINVKSAATDLHSGQGGLVPNSIHALVRLLDSMRSPDGHITVEGFYDEVRPLNDAERAQMARVPFDAEAVKARTGIKALYGEPGFAPLERIWARPTLEINGIWGGFQGDGVKTVIPAEAQAKITCRLVPDQDPDVIRQRVAAHVARHAPPQVDVTIQALPGQGDPYLLPSEHPGLAAAARVLAAQYGVEPLYVRSGGSVPVTAMFAKHLHVHTVTVGFALPDEKAHAPNEFVRIASFEKGQRAFCNLLEEFGR